MKSLEGPALAEVGQPKRGRIFVESFKTIVAFAAFPNPLLYLPPLSPVKPIQRGTDATPQDDWPFIYRINPLTQHNKILEVLLSLNKFTKFVPSLLSCLVSLGT